MKKIALLLIACAGVARADGGAPRKLTFEDAISIATGGNVKVGVAAEKRAVAEEKVAGTHAARYPAAKVDASVDRWLHEFDISFPGFPPILAREKVTSNLRVTVTQPLSGLGYLSEIAGAQEHDIEAASAEYDKAQLDVAYGAADAYMRVLSARAAADVAHKTVVQIQGELDRAQKLRAADQYNDIDVLRFKSAKAAADQAALRADTNAEEQLATFARALGLGDGDPIDVVDDLPPEPPPLALTLDQAQARAQQARPELRASRARLAASDDLRTAARMKYLPIINGVAGYEHITGFGDFQPANSFFAGLTLSWDVWNWGKTRDEVKEIEHDRQQIVLEDADMLENIKLEVRKRWLDARAARDSLAAVATQLEAAEEAYRLQQVRFDAAAATATDVLDAETDVARARLAATNARYDYFVALVALARSVGDLPAASGAPAR